MYLELLISFFKFFFELIKATLCGHKYAVNCLAVHPGGHIVSGSYDTSIRVWNIKSIVEKLKKSEEIGLRDAGDLGKRLKS